MVNNERDIFYDFWNVICKLLAPNYDGGDWFREALEDLNGPSDSNDTSLFLEKYGKE